MAATDSRAELKGFMEAIIQSNTHLVRTIIFVAALFAVICSCFFFALNWFGSFSKSADNVKVSMLKSGLLIEVKNPEKAARNYSVSQFLLPSNDVWFDTGIELDENEECEFKISGKVNLALNKLVESAKEDRPTKVNWTGPEGNEFAKLGDDSLQDNAKRDLLLYPGERKRIGNVVFFLQPVNEQIADFRKYFLQNRGELTKKIIPLGSGGNDNKIANSSSHKVRIYLSVNDIVFNFSDPASVEKSKAAYFGKTKDPKYEAAWKGSIEPIQYEQLWYDDNVGCFLVCVTIKKKADD